MRNQILIAALAALVLHARTQAQESEVYESAPINYSKTQPRDGVAAVRDRIASRQLNLGRTDQETLRALLAEFGIPVESQVLVFSKTSLQRQRIGPEHPRSVFFADNCYVGW